MQRFIVLFLASLGMLASTSLVFASGGYSGGGGFGGGGYKQQAPRQVDQTYEVGKAIFKGRQRGEPSLEYCVLVDGEKVPLKRKSVKSYKKTSYSELSANLYQCDQPDTLISKSLTRDSLLYVMYYLNKRHKLQLKGS